MKVGDKVRCKPGFNTSEDSGGSGYMSGKEFIISRISYETRPFESRIFWPVKPDSHKGIYGRALELVTNDNYLIY